MLFTHKKISWPAECVQWDGTNTEAVLALLNNDHIYATQYGKDEIMVRFSKPLLDQKLIDTLKHGSWVAIGMNGDTKCYSDTTFRVKYKNLQIKDTHEWVDAHVKLPEGIVLAQYYPSNDRSKKPKIIRACYFNKFEEKSDNDDYYEYNEVDDTYYIPEGWYECISNWDEYNSVRVSDDITHWQELPEPKEK